MKKLSIIILVLLFAVAQAQTPPRHDKAVFKEYKAGYYQNSILKGIEDFEKKEEAPKTSKSFKIDFSGMDIPTSVDPFTKCWHNDPVSQGNTGTCWCFSNTSFFESEIYRLTQQKVKLSEMYTVYWEYVEKAKRFIKERGNSAFEEGSEGNAVTRIWKKYGVVPLESYSGLLAGQTFHNHAKMYEEMSEYLKSVKANNAWNEELVISTIQSIMNSYLGAPPKQVSVGGKNYSPLDYLTQVLKFKPDDYIDVLSIMQQPFWNKVEYEVGDNWWHNKDYYNIPLDDYMKVIKNAIKNGYTICVGGDVSEAGFESFAQTAVVPTFDIPSAYIDDYARQFRFSNKTTTDDHGLHIVGYMEKDGVTWFLVKDSGAGSRNVGKGAKTFGYYFFHEDYVKLKMMDCMVHKDAFKEYFGKFKN
ncbi:MAG: C1 family peptidase [Bacteroidota bacterium]